MKAFLSLLLILSSTLPAFAEETAAADAHSSEAVRILKEVDAATRKVQTVRYKAVTHPTGVAVNFIKAAEGKGVLSGWNSEFNMPAKFYAQVKTSAPGSEDPLMLTGGGDGDSFFLINHQDKKAYEDMDPGVLGSSGQAVGGFGLRELVHDAPFDDELGAEKIEYLGTEEIGGEECHKIHVVHSGGRGEMTWFFAKKDHLPRRQVQHFSIPGQGDGTFSITLSDLEINPEIDPKLFKLKLPQGYEQIDDFAP